MNKTTKELPLRYVERELQLISIDPLVMFDRKGIILDVNDAMSRVTGRSADELIGTPFADHFTDPERAYKGVMLTFETGEVRDYELVMKARDGTETVVSYNASVYKDQKGNVVGAFAAARDITEHKRAEQEIQELQHYNRGLIEASLDPLVTFDREGIIMDVNGATIQATGRTRKELIGTPFADYFTDPERAYKGVMLTFETGEVRDYELVMKVRDGTETVVSYNASVYKDQTGEVIGAFAAARDITEQKNAEIALRESKAELDLIFQIAADGMCVIDADFDVTNVNKTFIQMVDMDEDEIIGEKCYDVFSGELCHSNDCPLEKLKRGEGFVERESVKKRPDGKEIPVILNAARLDRDGKFAGIVEDFKDITEHKQAEIALRESKAELELIFQIAADAMCVIDADFNIIKVNKTFIRMVDMDEGEIIGKKCYDVFSGELCHSNDCPLEKLKRGEGFVERESVKKRPDGKEIPVILNAARLDRDGKFVGIVEDFKDITERKQAEKEIRELQRYNRGLIEVSLDPLVTFDHKGIILDVNEATIKATGRTREELIGTPFADHFTDPERAYKGAMRTFETGEVRDYELVMKARDGTETMVAYNASVYKDQKGNVVGAFAAARDITERGKPWGGLRSTPIASIISW
jgi:PAS domain S-box-containing protein